MRNQIADGDVVDYGAAKQLLITDRIRNEKAINDALKMAHYK